VFDESIGGKGNKKCAYSLVYVNQKIASMLEKMPLSHYAASENIVSMINSPVKK
jgi:hypothetical protein